MGYCVTINLVEVLFLTKEDQDNALRAINALHEPEQLREFARGGEYPRTAKSVYSYAWVNNPPEGGFATLKKALREWRYDAEDFGSGSIKVTEFTGEKMGQDEVLWNAVAPFVMEHAFIEFAGEDGMLWGYFFENGKLIEKEGYVAYREKLKE